MAGDFNCHHTLWDGAQATSNEAGIHKDHIKAAALLGHIKRNQFS